MNYSNNNRKLILSIGLVLSFVLLILSINLYFNYQHETRQETKLDIQSMQNMTKDEIINSLEQQRETQPLFKGYYLFPFAAFIGFLVGSLVYYFMSEKVIKQEKSLEKNTKIILKFLNNHERKVIETLIENKGKVPQYELSHLPGLNKVRTHRILLNLEQKGIIHKERIGKVNKIILNKELYNILK